MIKNNKRFTIFLGGMLIFFFGLGIPTVSLGAKEGNTGTKARLIQIEDQSFTDRFLVILKLTGPVTYSSKTIVNPPRLYLDLKPCLLGVPKTFSVKDPSIAGVRFSQFNAKTVRVVFDFSQLPAFKISHKKVKPYEIIVDFPKLKPQTPQPLSKKMEDKYLPQTAIDEFKKEKVSQEILKKEEKAFLQKPKVTFDFYNTNLLNVLRLIAEIGDRNILVGDDVKEKKVTLSLKEVPWDEALNSILDAYNLKQLPRGEKTILVTTSDAYKKIMDEETKRRQDFAKMRQEEEKTRQLERKNPDKWETREIQIKNVDAKSVEDIIQLSIEKEKKTIQEKGVGSSISSSTTETLSVSGVNIHIISVPQSNIIIARGPERELDYIEGLIKTIDQPISQVMIEARIVEADATFTRDMGIQWGGGAGFGDAHAPFAGTIRGEAGTTGNNYAINLPLATTSKAFGGLGFAFATTNFNLDVRIQAMEQQGRGKTISSPKVLTIDNKEATIKQGQSIPVTTRDPNNAYSTVYRDAALVLKVTPHISSSKKIRIKVKIEKNEPDFTKVDSLGNPTIKTKEAETEMMVNDGDTVAIGGILFKKESYQDNRVPGLGSIPILGWLFKTKYRNTEDTELLIFITPKILKTSLSERFGNES